MAERNRRFKGRRAVKLSVVAAVLFSLVISIASQSWAGLPGVLGSVSLPADSIKPFFTGRSNGALLDHPLAPWDDQEKLSNSASEKEGGVSKELDTLVRGTLAILRSA